LDDAEVLSKGRQILADANLEEPPSFLAFACLAADAVKAWSGQRRAKAPWLREWAEGLRRMKDGWDVIVKRDPMIQYKPAHAVALAFHMSPAMIRYNRSANRTSKSQTGYAEHYLVVTGSHLWRVFAPPPAKTFIVGVNFSKYAVEVFEAKMVSGEAGNPLSPMFPEGGKWFYHYDSRKHRIQISCKECAEAGKAGSCHHPKSSITLFSDMEGPEVLMGGQYNLGHFDEHISEVFFSEAMERLKTVPSSSFIVTGTPLLGKSSWEYKRLESLFRKGPAHNHVPGRPDIPMVSVHTIDQYAAGLVPKELIDASKMTMDPLEQDARIWGKPAPLAKHSIFDRYAMHEMEEACTVPETGYFDDRGNILGTPVFIEHGDGLISIWDHPESRGQYIIGADPAMGLAEKERDYSCAQVLKLPELRQVARLHGWINPRDFARELVKLSMFYNMAVLVPERSGGLGQALIQCLKEIGYPSLFRDVSAVDQVDFNQDSAFGVDTNVRTKPLMVSALAQVVKERQICIQDAETIEEMRAFGQERSKTGRTVQFQGEGDTNDDMVMSLAFAVYVAVSYPVFVHNAPLRAPAPGPARAVNNDRSMRSRLFGV